MLEAFNARLLKIEKEFYHHSPRGMVLANELYNWLKKDNPTKTILVLTDTADYKYFIRSIRKAYYFLLNRKIDLINIDENLEKLNKQRQRNGKSLLSKSQYINLSIKKVMKPVLSLKIGTVVLDISPNPLYYSFCGQSVFDFTQGNIK